MVWKDADGRASGIQRNVEGVRQLINEVAVAQAQDSVLAVVLDCQAQMQRSISDAREVIGFRYFMMELLPCFI